MKIHITHAIFRNGTKETNGLGYKKEGNDGNDEKTREENVSIPMCVRVARVPSLTHSLSHTHTMKHVLINSINSFLIHVIN